MKIRDLRCLKHVCWEPDSAELRRFAIAMLCGFSVLGILYGLRGNNVVAGSVKGVAVGALLAVGSRIPQLGRLVYLAVYLPTSILGFVVSNVLLTLAFF